MGERTDRQCRYRAAKLLGEKAKVNIRKRPVPEREEVPVGWPVRKRARPAPKIKSLDSDDDSFSCRPRRSSASDADEASERVIRSRAETGVEAKRTKSRPRRTRTRCSARKGQDRQ